MPRNEVVTDGLVAGALKGAPDTDGNALQVSARLRFRVNVFDARRDRLPARHTNGGWWVLDQPSPAGRLAASHLQDPRTTFADVDHLLSLVSEPYNTWGGFA